MSVSGNIERNRERVRSLDRLELFYSRAGAVSPMGRLCKTGDRVSRIQGNTSGSGQNGPVRFALWPGACKPPMGFHVFLIAIRQGD